MQIIKVIGIVVLLSVFGCTDGFAQNNPQNSKPENTSTHKLSSEKAAQMRVEIKQLVDDYAISRDNADAIAYSNLFTEAGSLILYGNKTTGRANLRKKVEEANPDGVSMHVMSSGKITIIDEKAATGIHYMTLYTGTKSEGYSEGDALLISNFTVMGKYYDQYLLTDEGWKFAERRIEAIFRPVTDSNK